MSRTNLPFLLVVRDGWGQNPDPAHEGFNAVRLARTPVDDALRRDWPFTLIRTSGLDVGLPEGTMGNSEVGHQNLGAGRVVDQESVRITKSCRGVDGVPPLDRNSVLAGAIARARDAGRTVHLFCICSDAGVHGLLEHLYAVIGLCSRLGAGRVAMHLFTDGRDTGPFTGRGFVAGVESACRRIGVGRVASVIGRYWAMDRDNRWERVERAYRCLVGGVGVPRALSADAAIAAYYDRPEPGLAGDEFIPPTMIGASEAEAAAGRVVDGDAIVFCNYRGDRPRELVAAFVLPEFFGSPAVKPSPDTGVRGFDRGPRLAVEFVTMTDYAEFLAPFVRVAFPRPPRMRNIAGEHFSALGLTQFRCAETEKYPHVTFFFNDYRDGPFPGESRENPQSPRVATYDLAPEMAAAGVADATLRRLAAPDGGDILVINFANGDMVGHTGNLAATIRAVEAVDRHTGRLVDAVLARGGSAIVTADHGNAEQMWDPSASSPHTAHTTYDVPLFVIGRPFRGAGLRDGGRLADVIPTALDMLGLPAPPEMTGRSLLRPRA